MSNVTPETIKEVIDRIIGNIQPAGDTALDNERTKNLDLYIELLDLMTTDIYKIAFKKDDHRHSIQDMGNKAFKHLKNEYVVFSEWKEGVKEDE